jgi:hypothetical protein
MGDFRFIFESIQMHLKKYIDNENFTQCEMAFSIYQKIDEYWNIMDQPSIASAVLDPRTKLSIFSG